LVSDAAVRRAEIASRALDHADFGIEPFDKPERYLVLERAIVREVAEGRSEFRSRRQPAAPSPDDIAVAKTVLRNSRSSTSHDLGLTRLRSMISNEPVPIVRVRVRATRFGPAHTIRPDSGDGALYLGAFTHWDRDMRKLLSAILIPALGGCGSATESATPQTQPTFFITSVGVGDGGNLGGLEGADRHCQQLATAAGAGTRTWHAYLSTTASGGRPAVNARDRIGQGPWHNAKGIVVAQSIDILHNGADRLGKQTSLNEKGELVNGIGDTPVRHDILTGSQADGTAFSGAADKTCQNWTSSSSQGSGQVGHHDKQGGGENPTSWNSAHGSFGCSQADLRGTGGDALFYCFAI
jgi:hypothetical protein